MTDKRTYKIVSLANKKTTHVKRQLKNTPLTRCSLNYLIFLFLAAILAFLIASLFFVFLEREVLFLVFTAILFAIMHISYTKILSLAIKITGDTILDI